MITATNSIVQKDLMVISSIVPLVNINATTQRCVFQKKSGKTFIIQFSHSHLFIPLKTLNSEVYFLFLPAFFNQFYYVGVMVFRIVPRTTTNVIVPDARKESTLAAIRIASMKVGSAIGWTTAATDPMKEIATVVIREGSASAPFLIAVNLNVPLEPVFPFRRYATEKRIVRTRVTNLENAVSATTL